MLFLDRKTAVLLIVVLLFVTIVRPCSYKYKRLALLREPAIRPEGNAIFGYEGRTRFARKEGPSEGCLLLRATFPYGQTPFSPYGKAFKALPSGQTPFSPYGKAFKALPSGQTPFSPYGNSSASDSVTQNRNRERSGGTQYSKMTHWVPLEVPRRPITVTESDAKSLET